MLSIYSRARASCKNVGDVVATNIQARTFLAFLPFSFVPPRLLVLGNLGTGAMGNAAGTEPKRDHAPRAATTTAASPPPTTTQAASQPAVCPYPSASSEPRTTPYHSPSTFSASAPTLIKKFGKPSVQECLTYRLSLDFIVSNLKFSTVHHDAVTDGTMMAAWKEEQALLTEQLDILEKMPSTTPAYRNIKRQLEAELDENKGNIQRNVDPNEVIRCRGMRDMHHEFVRVLESMIPLLKEECPDSLEVHRKEDPEAK